MEDDKLIQILMQISSSIQSIERQIGNVCEKIANHESRLTILEHECHAQHDKTKNMFISHLFKLLGISLLIIGSLAGASEIISKFITNV